MNKLNQYFIDQLFFSTLRNLVFSHTENGIFNRYEIEASRILDVLCDFSENEEFYVIKYEIKIIGGTFKDITDCSDNNCSISLLRMYGTLPKDLHITKGAFEFEKSSYLKEDVLELKNEIDKLYDRFDCLFKGQPLDD